MLKGKGSRVKNRENKEIDAYKWFVIDLKENKAKEGYEFKSDALDVLSDYDDKSRYKVVSEISLKKFGIENPKEKWKHKFADGGGMEEEEEEEIDLFEDYDNIPANVQKVLDKYEDAFVDGDYRELEKALKALNKIGYTFEYDLNGIAYGLRPIAKMGVGGDVYDDSKFINFKKQLIKHSDFNEKTGDGFSSRYVGLKNKKGDKSTGEYLIEGNEITWVYTDEKGDEYASNEIPELILDLINNSMAKGGHLENENALMVSNNNKQIAHHTKEMSER
jgi:hypothetical protein